LAADGSKAEEEFLKAEHKRLGEFANEIAAKMLHQHGMECSQFDVKRIEESLWTLAEHLNDEARQKRSAAANRKALLAQFQSARQLSEELGRLLSSEGFSSSMSYLSWLYGRDIADDVKAEWGEDYSGWDEEWATRLWMLDHSRGRARNEELAALAASFFELSRSSDLLIKALERTMPQKPTNILFLVAETMVPVYWDVFPRGRIGGTGNSKYRRTGPLYTFIGTAGQLFGLDFKPENIAKTIQRYRVPMHGTREK